MRKMTMERFLAEKPDPDSVVAVRIKEGEWYFLAWMEDAEHYRIQAAQDIDGYLMIKKILSETGDVYEAVQNTAEYNFMDVLYNLDDDGNVIGEEDKDFDDEYDRFLSLFTFGRFACSFDCEKEKRNFQILEISQKEIRENGDLIRDGDYIFITEREISTRRRESFEQECYNAYQLEWMLSHGVSLGEALFGVGCNFLDVIQKENSDISDAFNILYFEGCRYANGETSDFFTKEEFLENEYLSATYMDRLLSMMPEPEKKKALWKEIMEGGEADE